MLGAWLLVMDSVRAEYIPVYVAFNVFLNRLRSQVIQTYFFARDDRVYKAFIGVLDKYKNEIQKHVNRRLRWQLNVLRTTLEGRSITYRVSD